MSTNHNTPSWVETARHDFEVAVDDVEAGSRFVVRNKVRILAIPTTIVAVGAAAGLDLTHVIPGWAGAALAGVVGVATMVVGASKIAAADATPADPALVPRDKDGGVLLNADEAVQLAASARGRAQVDDEPDDAPAGLTAAVADEDGRLQTEVPIGGQLITDDNPGSGIAGDSGAAGGQS